MAYQRRILSDSTETLLDTLSPLTFSGDYSSSIDCWNYQEVDFFIKVDTLGSATSMQISLEYTSQSTPLSSDWSKYYSEEISSGSAPQSVYTMEFDLTSVTDPGTISFTIPVRGRYLRAFLLPDATIATVTISVMRRA